MSSQNIRSAMTILLRELGSQFDGVDISAVPAVLKTKNEAMHANEIGTRATRSKQAEAARQNERLKPANTAIPYANASRCTVINTENPASSPEADEEKVAPAINKAKEVGRVVANIKDISENWMKVDVAGDVSCIANETDVASSGSKGAAEEDHDAKVSASGNQA